MRSESVKAGFLPLYLKIYDELTPGGCRRFDGFIREMKDILESSGITLADPGAVFDVSHVKKAGELFQREKVSFVITLHLCYSPSLLIADILEDLGRPILIIDSTPDVSFENMEDNYLLDTHGIHGIMDLTSVLKSRGINYTVISGHSENRVFRERLKEAVKSLAAVSFFRNQTIGLTGRPFEGMGDFSVDFGLLKEKFGISVKEIPVERLVEVGKTVGEADIASCIEEEKHTWD
ncbi:MAG: hypothetical protein E4H36_06575, partial [Spirochaetales bacterium]